MTRHPTARRVHRHESGTDDAFVANVLETSVWARQHGKTLIIGLVAAVVIVVGAVWFRASQQASEERAAASFTQVRALVQAGQVEQAVAGLEGFIAEHGGSRQGNEARLMLAAQYLGTNQAQKAIDTVEGIGSDFEDPVVVNATMLRAAAYEALNEPHRAEELYLQVGERAPFQFQKYDALDNAGRIRLQAGNAAGAAELYQRLVDMTGDEEPIKQVWQMRLAEARAAS